MFNRVMNTPADMAAGTMFVLGKTLNCVLYSENKIPVGDLTYSVSELERGFEEEDDTELVFV